MTPLDGRFSVVSACRPVLTVKQQHIKTAYNCALKHDSHAVTIICTINAVKTMNQS